MGAGRQLVRRYVAATPGPLGDRLHRNAARLRALADGHDVTARTPEELQ
jgi:hypothetical protein